MKPLELFRTGWRFATGRKLLELLADDVAGVPPGVTSPSPSIPIGAGFHLAGQPGGGASASTATAKSKEPYGWLGALLAHGGSCLAFELEYMTGRKYGDHFHLSPILMAHYTSSGNIELNMNDGGLLTNRYQEFPCPVYPMTGPLFLQHGIEDVGQLNGGTTDRWKQAADHDAGPDEPGWLIQWGLEQELHLTAGGDDWGIRIGSDGHLEHRPNLSGSSWGHVYPAKRVGDWAMHQSIYGSHNIGNSNGLGATVLFLSTLVPGSMSRKVIVPPYFRANATRFRDWYQRLLRWYYVARWIVWAGEMLLEHAHIVPPSWWKNHALCWGVGVPSTERRKRPSYDDKEPALRVELTDAQVLKILALVVKHTPPPGTKGATGEQIAPEGYARTLCDIPAAAGSVIPPIDLLDDEGHQVWAVYAVSKFKGHEKFQAWVKWVRLGIEIYASCVASGFGGAITAGVKILTAASSAIVQRLVCLVVTYALQTITKIGLGKMQFNNGDIVGLVGSLIEVSGLSDEVLKNVPEDLWTALKTAGAAIPKIAGTDWAETLPHLVDIQTALNTLQNNYHWNYADAAYGGLGLSKSVRDEIGSAADGLGQ